MLMYTSLSDTTGDEGYLSVRCQRQQNHSNKTNNGGEMVNPSKPPFQIFAFPTGPAISFAESITESLTSSATSCLAIINEQ